jgi:hypothetical protein
MEDGVKLTVSRGLLIVGMLVNAAVVDAAPIVEFPGRYLEAFARFQFDDDVDTSLNTSTGLWNDLVMAEAFFGLVRAQASQQSNIGTLSYGGSGSASNFALVFPSDAHALSRLDVQLTTDQAYDYSFAGFSGSTPTLTASGTGGFARVQLCAAGGACLINLSNSVGTLKFAQTGTLSPGTSYFFSLIAASGGTDVSSGSFDAALVLTPSQTQSAPEPGSLLLFSMGAMIFHAHRRRQKH